MHHVQMSTHTVCRQACELRFQNFVCQTALNSESEEFNYFILDIDIHPVVTSAIPSTSLPPYHVQRLDATDCHHRGRRLSWRSCDDTMMLQLTRRILRAVAWPVQLCTLRTEELGTCEAKDNFSAASLKPHSITLAGSELVRRWFEPASVMEFGFYWLRPALRHI